MIKNGNAQRNATSGRQAFRNSINQNLFERQKLSRERADLLRRLELTEMQLQDAMRLYEQASQQARTDALTGLLNRRAFEEQAGIFFAEYHRYNIQASIIIFDLDSFKQINDTLGHMAGDRILKAVARSLPSNLRTSDILARWGGEEFIVGLQHMDLEATFTVAERIRREIASLCIADATGKPLPRITTSLGVATLKDDDVSLESVIDRADRALYQAKANGRNQACSLEFQTDAIAS